MKRNNKNTQLAFSTGGNAPEQRQPAAGQRREPTGARAAASAATAAAAAAAAASEAAASLPQEESSLTTVAPSLSLSVCLFFFSFLPRVQYNPVTDVTRVGRSRFIFQRYSYESWPNPEMRGAMSKKKSVPR